MQRNIANMEIVLITLLVLGILKKPLLDFAGGCGVLVRLLRDNGVNAFWRDRHCPNILAKGFEFDSGDQIGLVTAFEVFEHLSNPREEISEIFSLSPNLLASTELMPSTVPQPEDWWYYGLDHGQHIGFFQRKSLEMLAKRHNKHLISFGSSYHLFTDSHVNQYKLRIAAKYRRIPLFLARRQITSKTITDHLEMKRRISDKLRIS
jgi:hypothetical protein